MIKFSILCSEIPKANLPAERLFDDIGLYLGAGSALSWDMGALDTVARRHCERQ